jgi:starch-binding outer membrane protein, SusD/RagB family
MLGGINQIIGHDIDEIYIRVYGLYININSYNEGKIEPFGKQMFPGISSQTSQQLLQIADLIHIRFADVLLMQSELKQDATGLNKVRARM